jgi:hypothetical protein
MGFLHRTITALGRLTGLPLTREQAYEETIVKLQGRVNRPSGSMGEAFRKVRKR